MHLFCDIVPKLAVSWSKSLVEFMKHPTHLNRYFSNSGTTEATAATESPRSPRNSRGGKRAAIRSHSAGIKAKGERNKKSRESRERTSGKNKGAVSPPVAYKRSRAGVRGWAFFEMVDRFAARNQYCWIASITPRKYNKALQSLPDALAPTYFPRARQNCLRDNGRSPGHPVSRLEGGRDGRARTPLHPSSRSTTSFSLFLLLSPSHSVFLPLRLCLSWSLTTMRRGSRPAGHQKSRLSEFQSEPASAWLSVSLSLGAIARIIGSPTASVTVPEHLRWLCVVPTFFPRR